MLTVGENSRVEIDEYIYNPEKNVRQAVVKLMQGQVRALVNKAFKANGSRFEIHTPSAVAAATGNLFHRVGREMVSPALSTSARRDALILRRGG